MTPNCTSTCIVARVVSQLFRGTIACALLLACGVQPTPDPTLLQLRRLEQLLREGVLYLRKGNEPSLRRAQAAFELAYEISAKDPRVLDGLGSVAFHRGAPETARYYFEQATMTSPTYARAFAHLALLAEKNGERTKALHLLQTALALDPLDYRARNNYGGMLVDEASTPEQRSIALQELLKARSEAPAGDPVIDGNLQMVPVKE